MYKVGDKLICRLTFNGYFIKKFLIDREYYILKIETGKFTRLKIGQNYEKYDYFYEIYLDKYFYTDKEIRKLKLEKLKTYM